MTEPLEEFAAHLADFEQLAPSTVVNCVQHAASLLASVEDCDAAARGDISVAAFSAWLRRAEDVGRTSGTRQKMWYAVRAYYRWLEHEGYAGPSPLDHVRPPRVRHAPRRDYTAVEAEAIMAAASEAAAAGTWRDGYDYALLAVLRYTGARSDEARRARTADLDLERRTLAVMGKGSKRRAIPLPHALVGVLRHYLAEVRPPVPDSPWLFPGRGIPVPGTSPTISATWLQTVLRRFGAAAGVSGPHHAHRWRHTYATHLLRSGVDVVVVRDLLGHVSVTTTAIYLHLLREDLRDGVDRAFDSSAVMDEQ